MTVDALEDGVESATADFDLDFVPYTGDGEITDAKTITALFWAEKLIKGEWEMPA